MHTPHTPQICLTNPTHHETLKFHFPIFFITSHLMRFPHNSRTVCFSGKEKSLRVHKLKTNRQPNQLRFTSQRMRSRAYISIRFVYANSWWCTCGNGMGICYCVPIQLNLLLYYHNKKKIRTIYLTWKIQHIRLIKIVFSKNHELYQRKIIKWI